LILTNFFCMNKESLSTFPVSFFVKRSLALAFFVCFGVSVGIVNLAFSLVLAAESPSSKQDKGYSGTTSCRECHEKFYKLWSPSRHAKAMQPFSAELAQSRLTPQTQEIFVGKHSYWADLTSGVVRERGPERDKEYPIAHVLGGKNVFYFLTPMERGRLQTLPVAYDVNEKQWFDTAKSGVRHFPGLEPDEPVHWTDWPYTFNTACYNCHVSQLDTNYDLDTDTYHTQWAEPGINCETCHGPCDEHIRVCQQAPKGTIPRDLKTIRGGRSFTVAQNNDACATCHAKAMPLTEGFMPGNRFFDHFDLVTLESVDYYPDGRDLGENYTITTWLLSPCVQSGRLNCLHCHTSSGRYRHKNNPNQSCTPCHQQRVENSVAHTFHKKNSPGNQCITCHMPMTTFARMKRSDHSMLPPTPLATMAFESPNACNHCHEDKDAAWADEWVRKWRKRDYQAPLMQRAELIDAARKEDWTRLSEMLAYIKGKDRNAIFSTSLIRLLRACPDPAVWPVIMDAAKDPSPLVRSSAIESLGRIPSKQTSEILLAATDDDIRLVRIKAAAALAGYPRFELRNAARNSLNKATQEYLSAMKTRPDQWTSHYNLGNFHLDRGDVPSALAAYDTALKLEPRAVMPMVNAAMAHALAGENTEAEGFLKKALDVSPNNAAANFNMGLLKAEQKEMAEAEAHLRTALKADPKMHEAAFNLGVILAEDRPGEAIDHLFKAFELSPNPKYAYTLAFYLHQNKDFDRASYMLEFMIQSWPQYADSYLLLADIRERQDKKAEAIQLLSNALSTKGMAERDRFRVAAKLRDLENNQ
jgi:tetratricopeptide (TPR) repeat protein